TINRPNRGVCRCRRREQNQEQYTKDQSHPTAPMMLSRLLEILSLFKAWIKVKNPNATTATRAADGTFRLSNMVSNKQSDQCESRRNSGEQRKNDYKLFFFRTSSNSNPRAGIGPGANECLLVSRSSHRYGIKSRSPVLGRVNVDPICNVMIGLI